MDTWAQIVGKYIHITLTYVCEELINTLFQFERYL